MIVAGVLLGIVVLAISGLRVTSLLRESLARAQAAPTNGRFAKAGGLEIYYQESGPVDGPTVLLVHGTGAWSEIWRETMQVLSDAGFRSIALDLPPFGFSERPVPPDYTDAAQASRILGLLDALGIRQVTLVGHSFGARPTVEAALRDPTRVQSLVLIDAALGLQAAVSKPPLLLRSLLASGLVRDALVSATLTNPMFSRRLLQLLILDPGDATDQQVRMIQQQFPVQGTTQAVGGWLDRFVLGQDHSMAGDRAEYSRLGMPTLVIWGEADSITPLPQARDLMTVLPNAELVVLKNTGHVPLIEDAPALNHALLDFLKPRVKAQ
jgi:pimeloyl-ACP methyl ester carboxylesterase